MPGSPKQIISFGDTGVHFDHDTFKEVLDKCGEREVCIITSFGGRETGKSSFLNTLKLFHEENGVVPDHSVVSGFESFVEESGIQIWDEPLFIGNDRAIVLLDFESLYCLDSSKNDLLCMLAMVVCSVAFFNITSAVKIKHVDRLKKWFDSRISSFLWFVIRDWSLKKDNNTVSRYRMKVCEMLKKHLRKEIVNDFQVATLPYLSVSREFEGDFNFGDLPKDFKLTMLEIYNHIWYGEGFVPHKLDSSSLVMLCQKIVGVYKENRKSIKDYDVFELFNLMQKSTSKPQKERCDKCSKLKLVTPPNKEDSEQENEMNFEII